MQVIILRGIPGAGKSTFTRNRKKVSADSFFEKDGEYRFDPSLLPHAHGKCLRDFIGLCQSADDDQLIVDNTNISIVEIAPYAATALAYGHDLKIMTLDCDPEIAAARNIHGVPRKTVLSMHKRMMDENMRFPPWWSHEIIVIG
jgi:hypothetical protein